jgi:hypothetical protein
MIATQLSYFDALTPRCAPANWRDLAPWRDDYRVVNGERVRVAYPLFYQDADGVVWRKKSGINEEYERWA